VSLAQILLVCNRKFESGADDFEGELDFVGDPEDRFTGLTFVGDGGLRSILGIIHSNSRYFELCGFYGNFFFFCISL